MDAHALSPRISVTARDPSTLRELLRRQSYSKIADAVEVSKTYIGDLAVGNRDRVSLRVGGALERALGCQPGELFHIDPAVAELARPYLA